jgi:RNA polymerase sigma-70 factor (ECF subfamily)
MILAQQMSSDLRDKVEQFSKEFAGKIDFILRRKVPSLSKTQREDVAQETYLKIWNFLQSERKISNLESYIMRIAYTTALDYVDKKLSTISLDEASPDYSTPLLEPGAFSQDELIEKSDLRQRINAAIETLKPKMRLVMKAHMTGMNIRETAEYLGWKESHVNTLYHRAKKQLKTKLANTLGMKTSAE